MRLKMEFNSSKHCRLFHEWFTWFKHVDKEGSAIYKECTICASRRVEIKGDVGEEMIDMEWGRGMIKDLLP